MCARGSLFLALPTSPTAAAPGGGGARVPRGARSPDAGTLPLRPSHQLRGATACKRAPESARGAGLQGGAGRGSGLQEHWAPHPVLHKERLAQGVTLKGQPPSKAWRAGLSAWLRGAPVLLPPGAGLVRHQPIQWAPGTGECLPVPLR